ncbi:hypothetical protein OROGR_019631 [Orobanche gracilis]
MKIKLIIWDEASMMHMHCFEALETSLKDMMKNIDSANQELPFGGKIIVFGVQEIEELQRFFEWIANIVDSTIGEHDEEGITIDIPHGFLIQDFKNPIRAIVESTYPSYDIHTERSSYFKERAILAPTLDVVDEVIST